MKAKTTEARQRMLDECAEHLLKQGVRSGTMSEGRVSETFQCMYKDNEGRQCAFGIFLTEDADFDKIETTLAEQIIRKTPQYVKEYARDPLFAERLQWIHDYIEPDMWEKSLVFLAMDYKLQINFTNGENYVRSN